jgi:LysM repeat protein
MLHASMRTHARSFSRWLAPLALIACVIAVLVIVSGGSSGSAKDATTQQQPAAQRKTPAKKQGAAKKPSAASTYTVQPGDTLSGIAAKSGVSLARIQQLNPALDSQALQTGQKVKLAP